MNTSKSMVIHNAQRKNGAEIIEQHSRMRSIMLGAYIPDNPRRQMREKISPTNDKTIVLLASVLEALSSNICRS